MRGLLEADSVFDLSGPASLPPDEVSDVEVKSRISDLVLWHYYEIHVDQNGVDSDGFNLYFACNIKPPEGILLGDFLSFEKHWDQVTAILTATRNTGELGYNDSLHVDYIRYISQEVYDQMTEFLRESEDLPGGLVTGNTDDESDIKRLIGMLPAAEACPQCATGRLRKPTDIEREGIQADLEANREDHVRRDTLKVCDLCGYLQYENEADELAESEEEDLDPKRYLAALPPRFDYDEVLNLIQTECSYCLDNRDDKKNFLAWIKEHEDLFPNVNLALEVIKNNDSWCTDNTLDMTLFFERLGFKPENAACPRCCGDGHEPGAPVEDDGEVHALCSECRGSGTRVIDCECSEEHQAQDTVCPWCRARGRRHWNDPAL